MSINRCLRRAGLFALLLLGATACSTSDNVSVMLFADPGKYQFHTCDQLLKSGQAVADREAKLRALIQKAEESAGGSVVSTLAYRGEHRTVVEELGVIAAASRRKDCNTPPSWRSTTAIQ